MVHQIFASLKIMMNQISTTALSQQGPIIVIPAYQPGAALLQLIHEIQAQVPQQRFIIVDDGTTGAATAVIDAVAKLKNVKLLQHAVNLGKGQALKTAFNYYLLHDAHSSSGIVTADADGQHAASDILKIVASVQKQPQTLWLGCRKLDKEVPLRSRFGNGLTRRIFTLLMGKSIHDTQTGLRGIPTILLADLLRLPTSRYEFELDMLILAIRKKVEIQEVTITTIYIDHNKSSHFNPILDSLKVYFVFIRYIAASLSSAVIDFVCFFFMHVLTQKIFISLAAARIISGSFNFLMCKRVIFKSGANIFSEAIKYLILALFSLSLSYFLVIGLSESYGINIYISKILADIAVFIINFAIQKVIVFPNLSARD